MRGRLFMIVIAMIVFLLVAFTPIVSLMLSYYGVANIFVIKTMIGLLTLGSGYFFASALLNKEKKIKEGEKGYRLAPLFIGLAIVMLAWYTDLPTWLADLTGTNSYIAAEAKELVSIGTRIWVSLLTFLGVILIRFSFYRKKDVEEKGKKKIGKGKQQQDNDDELYDTIGKMGENED